MEGDLTESQLSLLERVAVKSAARGDDDGEMGIWADDIVRLCAEVRRERQADPMNRHAQEYEERLRARRERERHGT